MTKAAIYCRVSTEGQEEGTSLDTQLEFCLKKAGELGYKAPPEYRLRESYSGLKLDRPTLNHARELVRSGKISALICYTLDRLSRDPIHNIIIQEELERYGVRLVLVTEEVDSSDMGKLITHIRGYAAKLETEKIKERTMRGKMELVKQGKFPQGTGAGIYGYDWNPDKKIRTINEYEAKIVTKLFDWTAEGHSSFRIATTLNEQRIPTKQGHLWHPLTIRRILKNTAYIGLTYYSGHLLPDVSPPIIKPEVFALVNDILKRKSNLNKSRVIQPYLLRGRIFCGECGTPCTGAFLNRRWRYYRCRGTYPTTSRGAICKSRYMRADKIESIVWDEVKKMLTDPEMIRGKLAEQCKTDDSVPTEAEKLKRKLKTYPGQKRRFTKLFRYKDDFNEDALLDELADLKEEWEADTKRLADLEAIMSKQYQLSTAIIALDEITEPLKNNIDNLSFEGKQRALKVLGIKVRATKEKLIIDVAPSLKLSPIEQTSACLHYDAKFSFTRLMNVC